MNKFQLLILLFFISTAVHAKSGTDPKGRKDTSPKGDWISLFDGKSLNGWHLFNKSTEIKSWKIEDGALVCLGAKGPSGSGDIISDHSFRDFELKWEWKVDKGSNSGVFYHIV